MGSYLSSFLPLLLQRIHAAHSDISLCFALYYHFGGLIAQKCVRTTHYAQTPRIECTQNTFSVYICFAFCRELHQTQTMRIHHHSAQTSRQPSVVGKLRCFYAHDFIRKSDDYSENAARRLIGIIRSYLFARFLSSFILVAVATYHFVRMLLQPLQLHIAAPWLFGICHLNVDVDKHTHIRPRLREWYDLFTFWYVYLCFCFASI